MKSTDIYVHADIHGASSVVIKNPTGLPVPPKTLNEAGTMAICYSVAWDAKVVTNAYWVWGEQVSKTAPTGEYLTTGSFMIRGKKNFLPPSHLILGLSFLFRLEDGCVEKHIGERKVLVQEESTKEQANDPAAEDDVELDILDESDEDQMKLENNPETKENNSEVVKSEVPKNIKAENRQNIEQNKEGNKSSTDSEEESKFPDTHIKIQHFGGTKHLITESVLKGDESDDDQKDNVIYLGDDKPIILKPSNKKSRSRGASESSNKDISKKQGNHENPNNAKQQQTKRGQKSKLKKIKEKYRDQDEEERKLRMEILQSSGNQKEMKKSRKGKDQQNRNVKKEPRVPRIQEPKEPNEVDDEEITVQASVDMIDALTGIPLEDDELLFAVPVIAPYNTLSNYKFKVKLTPGTAKRGKAAKTAVSMFLKDRTITSREKDLLKAVKDEQMARNLPGKVKLSAPKLQMLRK